ncbi:MAG: asparagine synthase (glutamine-hydrolyzing) [Bacteroidales bacterium]|nr:asparagine synthase (glutamine-hydrolyzing) [Bacteroidales bacterium]
MCGIAGIFHTSPTHGPVTQQQVGNMLRAIRHRGPDESGIYLSQNFGMGNVRLSIIDLASGSQPLSVENNRYWIVYNGELFNYPELRDELQKRGRTFQTASDTEVVLQSFAEWGPDCLKRFNGQYAISIWDEHRKELFLARDRAGIRPLFYAYRTGSFYFCSEIKGLFQLPQVERQITANGLAQVFSFWTTLTPSTPWKDVLELPPGHYMRVNQHGTVIQRYWRLSFPEEEDQTEIRSVNETAEELKWLLRDAVRIRLRADVEVAAYLSGGLDSTITTALIRDIEPDILNTFSIGFQERDFDESNYQTEASQFFGTHHTSFSCSNAEIGENFINAVYYSEYPLLRTAPVPMYLLSKKVREQNIKVVITGEGADENFAGYNIFKEAAIRRFWASQPNSTVRPMLLKRLYPYLPVIRDGNPTALKMFFGFGLQQTDDLFYSHLLRWHNTSRIRNYLSEDIKSTAQPDFDKALKIIAGPAFSNYGNLAKAQHLEFSVFMSNYLLSSQGDRMAMGNSVEGRYPFLDHRVIEFAANLPENHKLIGLNEKFILKKMAGKTIPSSILNRSKQAYRAPVSGGLLGSNAPDFVHEMLSEANLHNAGFFDSAKVNKLIQKMENGKMISEIDQMALSGILSTQLLHYLFICGNPPPDIKKDLRKPKVLHQPGS